MSVWRTMLAVGLGLVLAASIMAFVTLSVPSLRDTPRLGLGISAVVVLFSAAGVVAMLRRRK